MDEALSKDLGQDLFVVCGRDRDRHLKGWDERAERLQWGVCTYPDLPQLEDEGARRDRCHDYDCCENR